jgi:hypothetical protein
MFNQNIIGNKFDLNWSTTFSYTMFEAVRRHYFEALTLPQPTTLSSLLP